MPFGDFAFGAEPFAGFGPLFLGQSAGCADCCTTTCDILNYPCFNRYPGIIAVTISGFQDPPMSSPSHCSIWNGSYILTYTGGSPFAQIWETTNIKLNTAFSNNPANPQSLILTDKRHANCTATYSFTASYTTLDCSQPIPLTFVSLSAGCPTCTAMPATIYLDVETWCGDCYDTNWPANMNMTVVSSSDPVGCACAIGTVIPMTFLQNLPNTGSITYAWHGALHPPPAPWSCTPYSFNPNSLGFDLMMTNGGGGTSSGNADTVAGTEIAATAGVDVVSATCLGGNYGAGGDSWAIDSANSMCDPPYLLFHTTANNNLCCGYSGGGIGQASLDLAFTL